ncbi:hypothetical protein STCU_10386 [Strigomonas culicis]|uniref:Uncharacterized protein n=1 Tax=Strigomonas culicis TaxID=28005 RepID=S9TIA6_9TRYP|nr:hypothetical protein STCU_10386 [Strigomonas culicis]|eukprot:EPY17827.1 hypothetical protein STCU_10386 [Strigomonas culicis]
MLKAHIDVGAPPVVEGPSSISDVNDNSATDKLNESHQESGAEAVESPLAPPSHETTRTRTFVQCHQLALNKDKATTPWTEAQKSFLECYVFSPHSSNNNTALKRGNVHLQEAYYYTGEVYYEENTDVVADGNGTMVYILYGHVNANNNSGSTSPVPLALYDRLCHSYYAPSLNELSQMDVDAVSKDTQQRLCIAAVFLFEGVFQKNKRHGRGKLLLLPFYSFIECVYEDGRPILSHDLQQQQRGSYACCWRQLAFISRHGSVPDSTIACAATATCNNNNDKNSTDTRRLVAGDGYMGDMVAHRRLYTTNNSKDADNNTNNGIIKGERLAYIFAERGDNKNKNKRNGIRLLPTMTELP